MVPLELINSENLGLALESFSYFTQHPQEISYGKIKKDELIDFILDVTNQEDINKAISVLNKLYREKLAEENKPVAPPPQPSVTVPLNSKDLVAALDKYIADKKEQARLYDEFVGSFERQEEAKAYQMKLEDEAQIRQMIRQDDQRFIQETVKRTAKQQKITNEQAKELVQQRINNLNKTTPQFKTRVAEELRKSIAVKNEVLPAETEERITQAVNDYTDRGIVPDLRKIKAFEDQPKSKEEVREEIIQAVTSSASEKLTAEAQEKVDKLVDEVIKEGRKIDNDEVVARVRLAEPIIVAPEQKTVPVVLNKEEVRILDNDLQELQTSREQFIEDKATKIASNLRNSGLVKNLTPKQVNQISTEISRDNAEKLEPLAKQVEGKTIEDRQVLLSQIQKPANPVAILGPATDPKSSIYQNIPDAQIIAAKMEKLRIRAATEEDFIENGLSAEYDKNIITALRGDPLEKFQEVEEEENKKGYEFDFNKAYDLYQKFFRNQETIITSAETAIQLAQPEIIPFIFDASIGSYAGFTIASSIVAEASSNAIATQVFNPRLLQISNAMLPSTSFALPGATGVTISEGVVGQLAGYISLGGAQGVPVFIITGGQAGATLLAEGATTFYLGAPQAVAALAESGVAELGTGIFAEGLTTAASLGAEGGVVAATAVGGTELAVAGTGAAAATATTAAGAATAATGALGALAGFIATPLGALITGFLVSKILPLIKKYIVPIFAGIGALVGGVVFGGFGVLGGAVVGAGLAGGLTAGTIEGAVATVTGGIAALGTAFATAIIGPFIAALIGIPVIVALILFIINSGAYVVPQGTGFSLGTGGGVNISEPCDTASIPGNPAAAAVCIVDALIQSNLNPLNSTMFTSTNWSGFVSSLPAPVVKPIHDVTANNFNLQCTALVAASAAYAYSQNFLLNHPKACGYLYTPPSGYTAIHGTAGIAAGDFFIIDGTPNCSSGTAGHIGVVESVDGALISCADANYIGPGAVRVAHGCFALSQITGYLRKQ
ncbi:MAG TPA: hypothetical protein VG895_04540 [Patescibacteria group bacterium]|nr:hypothetical protein [Patescibacteria group bacterium]